MILLVDSVHNLPPSASKRDIEASAQAAAWAGFQVVHIEPDFSRCRDAEGALWQLKSGAQRQALWLGYIPSTERYRAIYHACLEKDVQLPNTPEEHDRGMELDLAYPRIQELTAKTAYAHTPTEAVKATRDMTYPLFVKGAVQSLKSQGWKACVAESPEELKNLVTRILKSADRSRGKVVLRELIKLRHKRKSGLGFPIGREYRVFVHRGEVVNCAYYWDCKDEFGDLSESELKAVKSKAKEAAKRLDVPYCAIDLGQDESLNWWVIETADAQFAGISPDTMVTHWAKLAKLLSLYE